MEEGIKYPCQKIDNYLTTFILHISVVAIFIILYSVYLILTIGYIKKYYKKRNLIIYWFDYILITFTSIVGLMAILMQNIQFILIQVTSKEPRCYYCDESFICGLVYFSLVLLMFFCSNNVIFDMIKGFMLTKTLNLVSSIKAQQKTELIQTIESIDIKKTVNCNYHTMEILISILVYFCLMAIYILIYYFDRKETTMSYGLVRIFFLVYRVLHLMILVLLIIMFIVLNFSKKKLMENNYYSNNIIIQRIYNKNTGELVFYCDFLIFKSLIDSVGNIPVLLFLSLKKFELIIMIVIYLCYFCYVFFTAAILFSVDKANKIKNRRRKKKDKKKKLQLLKTMFCLKRMNFNFGTREHEHVYEGFAFDYSFDEEKMLHDLNVDLSNTIDSHHHKERNTRGLIPVDLGHCKKINENVEYNTSVIYFVIFKLLYLFFKNNEKVYDESKRQMDEEGCAFNKIDNANNNNSIGLGNITKERDHKCLENRLTRISRLSRLSKFNDGILTSFIFGLNTLINSLEEKNYKKEFKHEFKEYFKNEQDISLNKTEFKIESLFNDSLYQLFPFYQLAIGDILKSLDPANNKGLFEFFKHQVDRNSTHNEFYTSDSFLSLEIFDKSFREFSTLKSFFSKYTTYLFDVLKNMNYTYLPLIIGVYNIRFLDYNKVVILYRNQLSFTPYVKMNHWIKFILTETPNESVVSQKFTDVIDVNEIVIKNNIKFSQEDYNEVAKNIKNDIAFIKELPFKPFPKINLFVGNQIISTGNLPSFESETDIVIDYKTDNKERNRDKGDRKDMNDSGNKIFGADYSLLRDTVYFGDMSFLFLNQRKEYGSEIESLFEREYEVKGSEGKFFIKIFFSMLFREDCSLNLKEMNPKYKLESDSYCDHIGHKLLTYIEKRPDLFSLEEEDGSDKENNGEECDDDEIAEKQEDVDTIINNDMF